MKRGDIVFIKNLAEGDRFIRHAVKNKEVYKMIEQNETHAFAIKAAIIDIKNERYNPLPDCSKFKLETRVIFLRNEKI